MFPATLSFSFALLLVQSVVGVEKFPKVPLANKRFASPAALPYKVDTDVGLERGQQTGFNICNSTTQNQDSLCQTSYLNSLDDFCLWAPPHPNSEVFDVEGEMMAWCSKSGHGTRVIPPGAIQGVQFIRTSDYIQVAGFIDQSKINLISGHPGGEMDPHGADLRGNPMGGIVFSNAWSKGNLGQFKQVIEWHNFMGSDTFCFKACDPSRPNAAHYCEHRYDRIGCEFNAPNQAQRGVFESCEGENQDFPGTYTGADGHVTTYTQPAESLGPITTMPYSARMPKSSKCVQHDSATLFAGAAVVTGTTSPPATVAPASSTSVSILSSSSSSTTALPSTTNTPASTSQTPTPSPSNAAEAFAIGGAASLVGVVFAALFLS